MENKRFVSSDNFMGAARNLVADYTNQHIDTTINKKINPQDVYIVWYSKSLQNHKALLSTPLPDGMYYEITYNGDDEELYLDAYKKFENRKLKCTFDDEKSEPGPDAEPDTVEETTDANEENV